MTTSITKEITIVLLRATICHVAWPMSRARYNGELSAYGFVARFWDRVGAAGEALEATVERFAAQFGIDIWNVLEPLMYAGEA